MDEAKKKAWKELMCAILHNAIKDIEHGTIEGHDVMWFAHTQWCRSLCEETGTDYQKYLNKIEELNKMKES